ncbi:unnamed protein product [Effrenium voratum]|uniref:Uncharacterized protein n=2 Tax=Effrenium voratum TaxID=2562239 RepID=A0AA36NEA0_9DINO|nr:unnamed protein product [Effrenium voratum]
MSHDLGIRRLGGASSGMGTSLSRPVRRPSRGQASLQLQTKLPPRPVVAARASSQAAVALRSREVERQPAILRQRSSPDSATAAQRFQQAARRPSQQEALRMKPTAKPGSQKPGLSRFTTAQKGTFQKALQEIRNGRKTSCWMWFVIPTPPYIVNGVEKGSSVNRKFALSDDEARAYLEFEAEGVNLRQNYLDMMTAVLEQLKAGRTPVALMGSMDAPKLSSSVQLFERISNGADPELNKVLRDIKAVLR